jgi:hypothetical protein
MWKIVLPGLPLLRHLNTPIYFNRLGDLLLCGLIYIITDDIYLGVYTYVYLSVIIRGILVKILHVRIWTLFMLLGLVSWVFFPLQIGKVFFQEYPMKFSFYLREPSFLAEYWALILVAWKKIKLKFIYSLIATLALYFFSDAETILLYFFLVHILPILRLNRIKIFPFFLSARLFVVLTIYVILMPLSFLQGSWRVPSNVVALIGTGLFQNGYENIQVGMDTFGMPWIESVYSLAPLLYSKLGAIIGGSLLLFGEYRIYKHVRNGADGGLWYVGSLIGVWFAPKWLVVAAFKIV